MTEAGPGLEQSRVLRCSSRGTPRLGRQGLCPASTPHAPTSLRFQVNLAPLRRWKGRRPVWVVVGMWAQGLWHLSKARLAPGCSWWPCPDPATMGVSMAGTDPAASPGRLRFDLDPKRQVQSRPHFAGEHRSLWEEPNPGRCFAHSETPDRTSPLRAPPGISFPGTLGDTQSGEARHKVLGTWRSTDHPNAR